MNLIVNIRVFDSQKKYRNCDIRFQLFQISETFKNLKV